MFYQLSRKIKKIFFPKLLVKTVSNFYLQKRFYQPNIAKRRANKANLQEDEALAEAVKQFPCLYDKSLQHYKDNRKKKCLEVSGSRTRIFF